MTKENVLKIALSLQNIAMSVDDKTLERIKPYLEDIETQFMDILKSTMHGIWIPEEDFDGDIHYECSACGESWSTIDGTPAENNMNYCPQCGAKMDGGQE